MAVVVEVFGLRYVVLAHAMFYRMEIRTENFIFGCWYLSERFFPRHIVRFGNRYEVIVVC